jgi:hypothetical protein
MSSEFSSSRVTTPSRPLSTSTYSGFGAQLKPRIDEMAHGEGLIEPVPAPVDPADEPIFAEAPARAGVEYPSQEERASQEWLEQNIAQPEIAEPTSPATSVAQPEDYRPIPVDVAPRSGSILGLSYPVAESEARMPEASHIETAAPERHAERIETERYLEPETPVASTPAFQYDEPAAVEHAEPAPPYSDERNSFFQFDEPGDHTSTDVSGPSFLGLGAPTSNDYLLEEDEAPPSHWRRNLFVIILLVFAGLGVMEWRSSQNGDSTNPMDVLHLKLPKKKGPAVDPNVPPPASDNSGGGSTNGKPDMVVEPNRPPAQNNPPKQPDAGNVSNPNPTQPTAKPDSNAGAADSSPSQNKSADTATPATTSSASKPSTPEPAPETPEQAAKALTPAPTPKPAPPAQVAKATPPPAAKPAASTKSANTPTRTAAKPVPSKPAPAPQADASLSGGSFELQKGIAAGPTELGRMWLWKAMGKGNGEAPVLLADMYAQGKGVPKDCEQAMLLLNAAAKKANPRARSKLGSMYAAGECVARDRVQAYKWMSAALQVNPGSEWLEKNRENLMSQMTAAERRRAEAYR